MKLFLKIVLSILILFVLVAGVGVFVMSRGLDAGRQMEINEVNLSALADGTYGGKHEAGRWTNEVQVTVKDHKIVSVDIVKDVKYPNPEWTEAIISRIIEKQTNKVDGVAGATVTCKAYLKAIENALQRE